MENINEKGTARKTKLRTLTGCFMCRRRRKKCDEAKIRCGACTKHNLPCIWPASVGNDTTNRSGEQLVIGFIEYNKGVVVRDPDLTLGGDHLQQSFSDDSTKIGVIRSAMYGLPGITTSVDHYLSTHLREKFLPGVLRGNAHEAFRNWQHLISIGIETNVALKAYLATAAMHASWTEKKFRIVALRHYNTVISDFRKEIEGGHVHGSEDWVMYTTNFLCLFEINQGWNGQGKQSGPTPHLEGLARVLKIRISASTATGKIHPKDRIAAESLLYFASTLSFYYSEVDVVWDLLDWDALSLFLDPVVFPGVSSTQNSPLLGADWKLYKTIFEITRQSHEHSSRLSECFRATEMASDLTEWKRELNSEICQSMLSEAVHTFQQTILYIIAAQILLLKNIRPGTRSFHSEVRVLVQEAMAIATELTIAPNCGFYLCWPLAILSCAVETAHDFNLLRTMLQKIWIVSQCGEVRRVLQASEAMWRATQRDHPGGIDTGSEQQGLLDCLDNPAGFFQYALSSSPDE